MESRTQNSKLVESAIIERVARIVFSVRGVKTDYTRLAAELEQAVPFDIFGVVLLRYDRQAVRVIVCRKDRDVWIASPHQHPLADSMLEQMLRDPKLRVRDYPSGLDGAPANNGDALSGHPQLRSTLIAPLLVEDRVLGALELGSTALQTYADESLQRLISAVVPVLAAAIESAQLGGNAAIQDRQREALKDVTSALTSKKDLSTILAHIVSGVSLALSVSSCLFVFNRQERILRLGAQAGLNTDAVQKHLSHALPWRDNCIISQSLARLHVLETHDLARDEHFSDSMMFYTIFGLRSIYCYPLFTGSVLYGVLMICSPEPGGFTPLKTDILSLFANQATVAIHNDMLFESVHQRNRFQESIERLELIHQQRITAFGQEQFTTKKQHDLYAEELATFAQVDIMAQKAFNVSFSTILKAASEVFLTSNEYDLQSAFTTLQQTKPFPLLPTASGLNGISAGNISSNHTGDLLDVNTFSAADAPSPFADTLALLAHTSEDALTGTAVLGELTRLILQLKQSTNWVKDAWFVIDLKGYCSYMNPAAETLCDVRLGTMPSSFSNQILPPEITRRAIEDVFSNLIPRIRNANDVCAYLQEFTRGATYKQEIVCVVAPEPLGLFPSSPSSGKEHADSNGAFRSDHHLQLIRYPLYTQQGGGLEAHALQIRDVSEQVRDERNRSALLSSVSHDLRTPLTTIKAAVTGLLQVGVDWSEQDRHDMLEDINSEADHLTFLVNSLVELSRIEMGALSLEKEWCDIAEIFYGVAAKIQPLLLGRSLQVQFAPHLPLIFVDHVQIGHVFYNLIENAVRHSPDASTIFIVADLYSEAPEQLCVQVIDQGPGIPAHERERIFTSYSQKGYGNALELAICQGIIRAHLGRIWIDPERDQGTCFIFTLPIHSHTVVSNEKTLL